MTIIIRRPHAYKFAADHKGASIPGLAVLDSAGVFVANCDPAKAEGATEVAEFLKAQSR